MVHASGLLKEFGVYIKVGCNVAGQKSELQKNGRQFSNKDFQREQGNGLRTTWDLKNNLGQMVKLIIGFGND